MKAFLDNKIIQIFSRKAEQLNRPKIIKIIKLLPSMKLPSPGSFIVEFYQT